MKDAIQQNPSLSFIILTFFITWFYNRSGYSILTVMLLHAMNNNSEKLFGNSYLPAMAMGVIIVIYFIIDNKMWEMKSYHKEVYLANNELEVR